VVKSHLSTLIMGWRIYDVDHSQNQFFLGRRHPLYSLEWWGHFLLWGVWFPNHLSLEGTDRIQNLGHNRWPTEPRVNYPDMVPQSFAAGGNRPYLELWAITGGPWYPGYITPTCLACSAGRVNGDLFIVLFLPIYMADTTRAWLDHLPKNSIDCWEDLKEIFTDNIQGMCVPLGNP
jgi:hypothetical protein